jgi:hypothetical protein
MSPRPHPPRLHSTTKLAKPYLYDLMRIGFGKGIRERTTGCWRIEINNRNKYF